MGLKPTHMRQNRVGFGMGASPSNIYNIYRPNYKLHPLTLVKVQFSPQSFKLLQFTSSIKPQLSNAVSQPHFNIFNILK